MFPRAKYRHTWKERDRIVLCLLKRRYNRAQVTILWNRLCSQRPEGLGVTALDGQYAEMKKGGTGHEIFVRIHTASQPLLAQQYQTYLTEIQDAVEHVEVNIHTNSRGLNRATQSRARTRSTIARGVPVAAAMAGANLKSNNLEVQLRPELRQFAFEERMYPQEEEEEETLAAQAQAPLDLRHERSPTPTSPDQIDTTLGSKASRKHPMLLFRCAPLKLISDSREENIGQRAIRVPVFGSKDFIDRVVPHMQYCKKYPSPFVSLRQSAKITLQKLEKQRSADIDEKIFFAIYSFDDVQEYAQKLYGPDSGPYLMTGVDLPYLPGGYNGNTEWLVYRKIGCEPIALLDCAQGIFLAEAIHRLWRQKDTSALSTISKCLIDVPKEWKSTVVQVILNSYSKKLVPPVHTRDYHLFMQIINDGTENALQQFGSCRFKNQAQSVDQGWVLVDSPQKSSTSQASSVNKLNELNSLPSNKTTSQNSGRKRRSSPLWSPDTKSESDQDMPIVLEHSPKRRRTSIANVVANAETYVEDDEDYDFTEGLDSSARKKIKEWSLQPGHQDETILPSIEASQPNSDFLTELYQEAYREVSNTISLPASLHVQAPINCHPENENRFSTKENTHSWTWVNSTRSLGFQGVSSGVKVFTMGHDDEEEEDLVPVKEEAQNGDEEEDEDVIFVGSNGRDLINLQLRSLSVQ